MPAVDSGAVWNERELCGSSPCVGSPLRSCHLAVGLSTESRAGAAHPGGAASPGPQPSGLRIPVVPLPQGASGHGAYHRRTLAERTRTHAHLSVCAMITTTIAFLAARLFSAGRARHPQLRSAAPARMAECRHPENPVRTCSGHGLGVHLAMCLEGQRGRCEGGGECACGCELDDS